MKNKLYFLDNEERNRILNLHENRTKSQYLEVIKNDLVKEDGISFWGLSQDENIFFTNKKIYINEGDELKVLDYGIESLPFLLNTARERFDVMLREGNLTLNKYIDLPKKFLKVLMESLEINSNVIKEINEHWNNKFKDSLNLLTENRRFIFEGGLNYELWEEVNLIVNQVILEQGWNPLSKDFVVWKGARAVGNTIGKAAKAVGTGLYNAGAWALKGISSAAKAVIVPVLKYGVVPSLRWIRRNLNTYFGIITEVIASMFPTVVIVKAVWGLIVLLDIWEILSDDYDQKDPSRQQMPFLFLLTDIISLLFTAVVGASTAKTLKVAIKQGASESTKTFLRSVIDKVPYLQSSLKYVQNIITKMFGNSAGTIINKVFGGLDTIITKLVDWIKNTFKLGKAAVKSTSKQVVSGKGTRKLALGSVIGVGLAEFFKENTLYKGMKNDERVKQAQNGLLINTRFHPELTYKGPATGNFDEETEVAVKQLQKKFNIPVTGKIDPPMAMALDVDLGPGNLEKLVGKTNLMSLGEKMMAANQWLDKKFGKTKGALT